jgi:hypothetical protein
VQRNNSTNNEHGVYEDIDNEVLGVGEVVGSELSFIVNNMSVVVMKGHGS